MLSGCDGTALTGWNLLPGWVFFLERCGVFTTQNCSNGSDSSVPGSLLTQAAPSPLEQDFGSVPTFQILSCIATENNSSYFSILTCLPLFTFPWPTQARLDIGQVSSLHIFSLSLLKNSEFFKLRFQTRSYHVFQIPLCDLGEKHHLVFVLGELDVAPLCMSGSFWHCEEEHPKVSKAFICPIWFII